jgi:hypothetical protein
MNQMNNRWLLSVVVSALFALSFTSCSNDNDSEDPYFYIENQPTGITVAASGVKQASWKSYTIRSNRPWKITKQSNADWVHVFADEGEDDGIFDVWVDENALFTARTENLIFNVDGQEQPVMFRVDQQASVPTVVITNASTGYEIAAKGGILKVPVTHNVSWTAALSTNDWLKVDSIGKDTVYLSATKNTTDAIRKVTLTATGTGEYTSLTSSTVISQPTSGIILSEHFDWMQEGKSDFLYNYPEVNSQSWSADELAHGWYTNGISMYGGLGYLKVGKTNYGGDLESPKLSAIDGKQDVTVTFKSIGYISAGGTKDDGVLQVIVTGGGTISDYATNDFVVNGVTYKAATMGITVYPNSSKLENGDNYDPWAQPDATFTFHITGATKDTQLIFVGGAKWGASLKGVGQGKNRCYFDDVKVVATE